MSRHRVKNLASISPVLGGGETPGDGRAWPEGWDTRPRPLVPLCGPSTLSPTGATTGGCAAGR
jgi:hypothetical protein